MTSVRPSMDEEARFLGRARAGDLDAFVSLVSLHDRALRALGTFEGGSAFGTWLHRIAYNACLDELRRGRSRGRLVPLEEAQDRPDQAPDPADVAAGRGDLAAALAALPPDLRAAVLLVDAEGMDYRAAGEVLGIPPGTVGSRLARARAALRRSLALDDTEGRT